MSVVSAAPSGTVTFLFSDIEGSTRLWEARGVDMASALVEHDKVLHAAAGKHGGYVFATGGDGFAIAFDSAVQAVLAAVEVQKAIGQLRDPVPLRVRLGMHSGEAVERGGDYFGPVVNRAARLMGAANGGQIVCSLVTAELARPALPDPVTLSSLGSHRLKDLLEPEVILQVGAPGLPSSFPPLRSLDVVRHNLPVQQTRLIGRSTEVATVLEAVEASRLVTLTGVGGCGKTRLALAAAVELAPRCRDGAFLVPLAVATDRAAIVEAITGAINARLVDANADSLAAFLCDLDVLLVLDNCEHLLDDVADVTELLLSRGSGPKVLATSREALGADGERVLRVPSLPVETDGGRLSPAVLLMLDRTGGSLHGAPPGPKDLDVIEEICRRLDGIPLAIEFAAAQLDVLAPAELLNRLDQRFDLLVGGHGRRRQRQQTLQAMMEWSWELLDPVEQRLLAVLSVFAGDWPLEAGEAVGGSFVSGSTVAALRRLTAKSLVEPVYAGEESRFRLLETVRLFAAERLVEMGIADQAREQHAAYHVHRARGIGPHRGFNDGAVIAAVQTDLADIDAALGWLAARADWASAADVALLAGGCWASGIQAGGGLRWFGTIEPHIDDPALRAVLLATGGYVAIGAGEPEMTRRWEREALDLGHDDQRAPYAVALAGCLRAAPLILTQPEEAQTHLLDAFAAAERVDVLTRGLVQMWINMADWCQPTLDLPIAPYSDPDAFGGPGTLPWSTAREFGALRLAELGDYDAAVALLTSDDRDVHAGMPVEILYRRGVEALAGDPDIAFHHGVALLHDIRRFSNAILRGELAVVVGISLVRLGEFGPALEHLESAKRAPMTFPFWYALARRHGRKARDHLSQDEAAHIVATARSKSAEDVLAGNHAN